jgi:phage terminase large subunit-like protein
MRLRGSRLHKRRQKAERDTQRKKPVACEPKSPDRAPLPRTQAQWRKLLREIPGYDPYADGAEEKYRFSAGAARPAITFFETRLHHVKGPKSRELFILERWQHAVLANLFGWLHKETGYRRYREALFYVPRKNGKTPLAAGIILYMLAEDGEYGAEVYGCASTYKQASLVFYHARGMVVLDEEMNQRLQVFKGQDKSIQIPDEDAGWSTYQVAASESLPAHGWHSHAVVIDELHTQPNGDLLEAAETSTGARSQPLLMMLTTADYEREGSVCNERHDYACKVRDGIIRDPTFLPVIYEAPKDADWHDRSVWKAANPNLDVSLTSEYMERAYRKAVESPGYENTFKRLHLNIRTAQDIRLVPKELWDACATGSLDLDDYRGQVCWAGLDLAAFQDLIAFVLAFKSDYGTISLVPRMWLPEQTAREAERKRRIPYTQWAREGHIQLTDGGEADYDAIRRDIVAVVEKYDLQLRDIAADRLFQGLELCQKLSEQEGLPVTKHGQGFMSYAAPMKAFMELLAGQKLEHGGHPVLAWHASNVMAKLDAAGNMKPDREKSTEKIDGFVAAVMAVGRAVADVEEETEPMMEWA